MALTGAEYLESIRDGREVWLHGEKVADVTTHPGFENSARFLASLYDTLHQDQHRKTLTWTTPRGAVSHKAFMVARPRRNLSDRITAMEVWARPHYGFMGRTPAPKEGSRSPWAPGPSSSSPTRTTARGGARSSRTASSSGTTSA